MIISGQKLGSKLQRVVTLGDGCWLPNLGHTNHSVSVSHESQGEIALVGEVGENEAFVSQGFDVSWAVRIAQLESVPEIAVDSHMIPCH